MNFDGFSHREIPCFKDIKSHFLLNWDQQKTLLVNLIYVTPLNARDPTK